MSVAAVIAIILGVAAVGEGIVIGVQVSQKAKTEQAHDEQVESLQSDHKDEVVDLQGRLSTCLAKTTPESLDAAGRILSAAQETDIADTNLRAAVVAATPLALYAEAVIETGSPRSIDAAAQMAGCRASNTTGDSARTGCSKEVPEAWKVANAALAQCPACPHPCDPVPCVPCAETEETAPDPE